MSCCAHHAETPDTVKDPVCGMTVNPATAKHRAEHGGKTYFFCSNGCRTKFEADPDAYLKAKDPVCGMSVTIETAKHRAEHDGKTYYFCCNGCRTKFEADPGKYLAPKEPPPPPVKGAIYTCPMDPEIRQEGPGSCPICGMALEPLEITAEAPPNAELADFKWRFWTGLALSLPVVVLHMTGIGHEWAGWVQAVLATPVVLWIGAPFLQRGWASLRTLRLNMFTLIGLGTSVSLVYSLVALLAPGLFPAGFRDAHGMVPLYFEPAAVITVLALLGQVLELRAREQTGGAIRALLGRAPATAWRIRPGHDDAEIPRDTVQPGDLLRLRPGAAIPVDGIITEGTGAIDESMITGESSPVTKRQGDAVIGGTVNGGTPLVMQAKTVGAGTVLARIVALVAEAQRSRAPIQRLADTVAGWFVPAVLLAAALTFLAWAAFGPAPSLSFALAAAVSVVIVACPCALGLATPMSITVGLGKGAALGVLFREAQALERLAAIDTIVFDKTGTLTEGRPAVTLVRPVPGRDRDTLLHLAASLERPSEHPLATALRAATTQPTTEPTGFTAIPGQGVTGQVEGRTLALGNAALMASVGITPPEDAAAPVRDSGGTALFLSIDGVYAGLIGIADPIKPAARPALDALRDEGVQLVMLTGDHRATAEAVGRTLGITTIEAGVRPADKHATITRLRAEGRAVAMAGDGVNDAPALAAADVGIAMGTGTDIAMQSAGITLMRGDLVGIVRARHLARATMRNIRQNLGFAFAYNVLGVPLAAGVLYPAFGLLPGPIVAAVAMSLSSVCVIGNALRLRFARV